MTTTDKAKKLLTESLGILNVDTYIPYDLEYHDHGQDDAKTDYGHWIAPESQHASKWTMMGALYRFQRLRDWDGDVIDEIGRLVVKSLDMQYGKASSTPETRCDAWEEIGHWEYETDNYALIEMVLARAVTLS